MKLIKKVNWSELSHEYGLDGQRLLPWDSANFPFGGAYCVVRKQTSSLKHINEPSDEEEFFIAISGTAMVHIDDSVFMVEPGDQVFIPKGSAHYIQNPYDTDFHLYAIWWNRDSVSSSLKNIDLVNQY